MIQACVSIIVSVEFILCFQSCPFVVIGMNGETYRASGVTLVAVLIAMVAASPTKGWSGRSLSLLDP